MSLQTYKMDKNEFPDVDEEYDLIPTNIFQGSNDFIATNGIGVVIEEDLKNNTREISPVSLSNAVNDQKNLLNSTEKLKILQTNINSIPNINVINVITTETKKKRTFDELFGDIKDLLEDNISNEFNDIRDGKRPRWDEPNKIIQAIRHERNKILEKYETESGMDSTHSSKKMGCVSTRVPTWNFIAITRKSDCKRLYVKIRPNNKFNATKLKSTSEYLSTNYHQLKEEAEKIIINNTKLADLSMSSHDTKEKNIDNELWVNKYSPKTYMDLLSDETVNRDFLRWMKLWDKIVFHRQVKQRKRALPNISSIDREKLRRKPMNNSVFNRYSNKCDEKKVDFETVDNRGYPLHRIALISGPPGLGKTTLAHIVAKHAGYNVVDINASDDRGIDVFRQTLLASTQMKSIIGDDPRPNCLILDEIDGAPAASIELLIKFAQGKLQLKGKKTKNKLEKTSENCKRPIICICNEAYTPSLRPLRAVAYMVSVSKVNASNLADRLMVIAHKENIRVSQYTLLQLAERSGCDIRSCLGALQYMGNDFENFNINVGRKDTRKGMFELWKQMLQIPMGRNGPLSIGERIEMMVNSAYTDNSERLVMGVFENYPSNCHDKMERISNALEWFQFYDEITTTVMIKNDWRVMPYVNFAFASWHLGFARPKNPKLTFPQGAMEAQQKIRKSMAIVISAQKSFGRDCQSIILDFAPCLFEILNPRLRAVAINLYSSKEKNELKRIINVMLDLGLCFIQEKSEDGSVNYNIEPNLYEIGIFPNCKARRGLFYTTKQVISQEFEVERLKRAANMTGIGIENLIAYRSPDNIESEAQTETLKHAEKKMDSYCANNLIHPIELEDKNVRDFFKKFKLLTKESSRVAEKNENCGEKMKKMLDENGVWFKYNEGYSNAIRRKVKISDVL